MSDPIDFDSITGLLQRMKALDTYMSVFHSIETGISDVVALLEKKTQEGGDDAAEAKMIGDAISSALSSALTNLKINVAAPVIPAPIVNFTPPPESERPKCAYEATVVKRDELGRIERFRIQEV